MMRIRSVASALTMPVATSPRPFAGNHVPRASHFSPNRGPTPKDPILLLEGDQFYVSNDGVARTLYQLESTNVPDRASCLVAIEEVYDLKHCTKDFVVRLDGRIHHHHQSSQKEDVGAVLSPETQGVVHMGPQLSSIHIQEIETELLFSSAGTGATTWEASIAMAIYFSRNPNLLRGHIVEVGCGVGLGGILNHKVLQAVALSSQEEASMTLTDGNEQVVCQCQENLQLNGGPLQQQVLPTASEQKKSTTATPIHVAKLDWKEFVAGKTPHHANRYDTVIACDCAYLHPDVPILSETVVGLLRDSSTTDSSPATIHLFGPYNRSAFHEVIKYLSELGLEVVLETIDMERFRLKPGRRHPTGGPSSNDEIQRELDDCIFASTTQSKFLHVSVSRKAFTKRGEVASIDHLADID